MNHTNDALQMRRSSTLRIDSALKRVSRRTSSSDGKNSTPTRKRRPRSACETSTVPLLFPATRILADLKTSSLPQRIPMETWKVPQRILFAALASQLATI